MQHTEGISVSQVGKDTERGGSRHKARVAEVMKQKVEEAAIEAEEVEGEAKREPDYRTRTEEQH